MKGPTMSSPVDVSRFREHRALDECKRLLHYGHVIPVSRGYTARYVAEHFPGWTWNELVAVFVAAGIFVNRGGSPPTCDDRVATFHFSSSTDFFVEWADGVEPDDVAAKRSANDRTTGQYVFDAGGGAVAFSLGGSEPPE
jgi:hypothetical protein